MLTQTADYALRAVLLLAREGGSAPMHANDIADAIGAPRNYLSKTMHALAKAGIVRSARGPQGGFTLAVAPAALTVARISDVFDEPRVQAMCLLGRRACDAKHPCAAHGRWHAMMRSARDTLDHTSVDQLLRPPAA